MIRATNTRTHTCWLIVVCCCCCDCCRCCWDLGSSQAAGFLSTFFFYFFFAASLQRHLLGRTYRVCAFVLSTRNPFIKHRRVKSKWKNKKKNWMNEWMNMVVQPVHTASAQIAYRRCLQSFGHRYSTFLKFYAQCLTAAAGFCFCGLNSVPSRKEKKSIPEVAFMKMLDRIFVCTYR